MPLQQFEICLQAFCHLFLNFKGKILTVAPPPPPGTVNGEGGRGWGEGGGTYRMIRDSNYSGGSNNSRDINIFHSNRSPAHRHLRRSTAH